MTTTMMMSMSSMARFLADVFLETLQNLPFFFLRSFIRSRSWFRHGLPLSLSLGSALTITSRLRWQSPYRFLGHSNHPICDLFELYSWAPTCFSGPILSFSNQCFILNSPCDSHYSPLQNFRNSDWMGPHFFPSQFSPRKQTSRLIETNMPNNLVWSDEFFSDLKFQSPSYQM